MADSTHPTKRPSDGEDSTEKRIRPNYSDIITVLVGEEESKFVVHQDLICSKSPFFAAACSKNWLEGQVGVLRLPDHQPLIFTTFLHWLYTQTIDMTIVVKDQQGVASYIVRLWSLAHYLQVPELCNKTVDAMLELHRQYPTKAVSPNALKLACEIMPSESGLRRLLLDMTVSVYNAQKFERLGADIPQDFVPAIAEKLLAGEQKQDSDPLQKPRHYYHDHEEGRS